MYKFILPLLTICVILLGCANTDEDLAIEQQRVESAFAIESKSPPVLLIDHAQAAPTFDKAKEVYDLSLSIDWLSDSDYRNGVVNFPKGSSTPGSGFVFENGAGYHVMLYMGQHSQEESRILLSVKNGDVVTITRLAIPVSSPCKLTQTELSGERVSFTEFDGKNAAMMDLDDGLSAVLRLMKKEKKA
jgi:hypothetical protein